MSKKIKALRISIITICATVLLAFIGCGMFQDAITPCYISPIVMKYVDDANDIPLLPPFKRTLPWYTSIFDAEMLDLRIDFIYNYRQAVSSLNYHMLKGLSKVHIAAGRELQKNLFSPGGALGMLLPASMMGILGTFAGGRFVKSPREKELEKKANGGE